MVQNLVEMIQNLKVSELVSLNEELMTAFGIDKSMLSAAPAAALKRPACTAGGGAPHTDVSMSEHGSKECFCG